MTTPGGLTGAVALLALLAFPAAGQQAPRQGAVPAERPAERPAVQPSARRGAESGAQSGAEAAADEKAEPATDTGTDAAPETAPEPAKDEETKADDASDEAEAPPVPPELPLPQQLAETDLDLGMCLGRLAAFGTVFERGRPVTEEGGACGIVNPVRVTEIVPGVTLAPQAIMRCETAAALAEWVSRFALPASALLTDRGRLTEVTQGSAYICRGVMNDDAGDLSEHALGNAIDIMGFRFASGPTIPIEPRARESTEAEAFQRTVRAAACLSFTTVLGPGEAAHDDHLHLDIKARESGYRLCR